MTGAGDAGHSVAAINDPAIAKCWLSWLGFYGGVLGTIAGVLIAGYWVRSRTKLSLGALYTRDSRYWFAGGWNWRAVVATVAGALLSVGGAYSSPAGSGPFPTGGLIPALKPLYDYSWVVGLGVGFALYLVLSLPVFGRTGDTPAD